MYGHVNSSAYDQSSGYFSQYCPSNFTTFPQTHTGELDYAAHEALVLRNGNGNANGSSSTGSGCTSSSYIGSPSSPLSCCTSSHPPNSTTMMQRSLSSHSLHHSGIYPHVSSPTAGLSDLDISPVRRVLSTGDLDKGVNPLRHHHHHRGGSPLANESTSIIIEGMAKACRYSPEEKKERIERYRSKRTQRNFNKKIQYACRKTLADSRPRIRGRFARNDETEKTNYSADLQWNQMAGEDEDDEENWIHLLDSFSSNLVP